MSPANSANRTKSPKVARFSIGVGSGRSSSVFTRSSAGWPPLQSNGPARSLTVSSSSHWIEYLNPKLSQEGYEMASVTGAVEPADRTSNYARGAFFGLAAVSI
jgi:hypothetical protein